MKKQIITILLWPILFCCCSKEIIEHNEQSFDNPAEVVCFNTDISTKGSSVTESAHLVDMGVFCAHSGTTDWSAQSSMNKMLNKRLTHNIETGRWIYDGEPVKWGLTTLADRFSFFSYSPFEKGIYHPGNNANGNGIKVNENVVSGIPTLTYTVPTERVASQPDLMFALPKYNTRYTGGFVHLKMMHALSQITFSARVDDNYTGNNVYIKNVTLKNLVGQATASILGDIPQWNAVGSTKINMSVEYKENPTAEIPNALNKVILTKTAQPISTANGAMFAIPQAINELKIPIEITFARTDNTGKEELLVLPYTLLSPAQNGKWNVGEAYNYTVVFAEQTCTVKGKIVQWSDQNVEANLDGKYLKLSETTAYVELNTPVKIYINTNVDKEKISIICSDPSIKLNYENGYFTFPAITNPAGALYSVTIIADNLSKKVVIGTPWRVINNLKIANGNLVADGATGCKIGAPQDAGLYFQFGSLIGYKGGANGDGTGAPSTVFSTDKSLSVKPTAYSLDPLYSACSPYDDAKWPSNDYVLPPDEPNTAFGDPCRYYLGKNWRVPTIIQWKTIFGNAALGSLTWINTGWQGTGGFTSQNPGYAQNIKDVSYVLPTSSHRNSGNGEIASTTNSVCIGEDGCYWTSSVDNYDINQAPRATAVTFKKTGIAQSSASRGYGHPIRCILDEARRIELNPNIVEWRNVSGYSDTKEYIVTITNNTTNAWSATSNNDGLKLSNDGQTWGANTTGTSGQRLYVKWLPFFKPDATILSRKGSVSIKINGITEYTKVINTDQNAIQQPPNSVYIEATKVFWAKGNLIQNGTNGCKIGSPSDGGLYFKFGSLIGWNGGYYLSGVGMPSDDSAPYITTYPLGYKGEFGWTTAGFFQDNNMASGNITSLLKDDAVKGIGDPCRYYLGGKWRLPTQKEFLNSSYYSSWTYTASGLTGCWFGVQTNWGDNNAIYLPKAGRREDESGYLTFNGIFSPGNHCYYWSGDIYNPWYGYELAISTVGIYPYYSDAGRIGHSIRCVSE
ncbi:MAG: hypothetical protein ACRDDZ_02440 [Marinifilaceae bacterium]